MVIGDSRGAWLSDPIPGSSYRALTLTLRHRAVALPTAGTTTLVQQLHRAVYFIVRLMVDSIRCACRTFKALQQFKGSSLSIARLHFNVVPFSNPPPEYWDFGYATPGTYYKGWWYLYATSHHITFDRCLFIGGEYPMRVQSAISLYE
eukprot:TRINITY_DN8329_c0_g1_i1.p2 TRINITY_DN8329_c0_g1~~TRINITY_DN8329_c0_g1_i1.p2  ORF type:complete len:148 (-),score=8.11 TRINITY_DN8329_c0_g1_i1:319-762(-)